MELVQGQLPSTCSVAILPGGFHPPTIAHLGLAETALSRVDTVIFALPRSFPHKEYEGVTQSERLQVLTRLTANQPRFAVAITDGGLFVDMARELRRLCPSVREVFLLCGRDAAERIVRWSDYPENEPLERQWEHFSLLVAGRQGAYHPPPEVRSHVELLPADSEWDNVSSTRVRQAIKHGDVWKPLVPPVIHEAVEAIYSPSRLVSRNVRNR